MASSANEVDRCLRAEADEILQAKGLWALLSEFGTVHPTGSYTLGVMTWRDLDLYLVKDSLMVAEFFTLGSRIADLLTPVRMSFRNERVARTEGLPEGLYWGVYVPREHGDSWKIDIWAVGEVDYGPLKNYCDRIAAKLTPDARRLILEIKTECWRKPGYRRTFFSRDIYEAVLEHGVTNLNAFREFLRTEKGCMVDA
jgi:hypothetical protein